MAACHQTFLHSIKSKNYQFLLWADGEFKKRKKSLYIVTSITGKHINGNIFRNLSLSWISDPGSKNSNKRERWKRGGGNTFLKEYFSYCFHFSLFRFVSVDLLIVSVQSKHRNSLFRYRSETTETNVLFRIGPKPVSVPVSVVSNRN